MALAGYVWKPVVFVEMKKLGGNLRRPFAHLAKSAGSLAGLIEKKQAAANSVLLKPDLSRLNAPERKPALKCMRCGCAGGLPGIC